MKVALRKAHSRLPREFVCVCVSSEVFIHLVWFSLQEALSCWTIGQVLSILLTRSLERYSWRWLWTSLVPMSWHHCLLRQSLGVTVCHGAAGVREMVWEDDEQWQWKIMLIWCDEIWYHWLLVIIEIDTQKIQVLGFQHQKATNGISSWDQDFGTDIVWYYCQYWVFNSAREKLQMLSDIAANPQFLLQDTPLSYFL